MAGNSSPRVTDGPSIGPVVTQKAEVVANSNLTGGAGITSELGGALKANGHELDVTFSVSTSYGREENGGQTLSCISTGFGLSAAYKIFSENSPWGVGVQGGVATRNTSSQLPENHPPIKPGDLFEHHSDITGDVMAIRRVGGIAQVGVALGARVSLPQNDPHPGEPTDVGVHGALFLAFTPFQPEVYPDDKPRSISPGPTPTNQIFAVTVALDDDSPPKRSEGLAHLDEPQDSVIRPATEWPSEPPIIDVEIERNSTSYSLYAPLEGWKSGDEIWVDGILFHTVGDDFKAPFFSIPISIPHCVFYKRVEIKRANRTLKELDLKLKASDLLNEAVRTENGFLFPAQMQAFENQAMQIASFETQENTNVVRFQLIYNGGAEEEFVWQRPAHLKGKAVIPIVVSGGRNVHIDEIPSREVEIRMLNNSGVEVSRSISYQLQPLDPATTLPVLTSEAQKRLSEIKSNGSNSCVW